MKTHISEERLSAFIDGKLDVIEMRDVAAHAEACSECTANMAALKATKQMLRSMAAPPSPSPEFWANMSRVMRTADLEESKARVRVPSMRRRLAAGFAALAGLGVMIASPLLISQNNSTPQPVNSVIAETAANDVVDAQSVSALVRAHTESVSVQPLADPDRQAMLAADVEDAPLTEQLPPEASSDASVSQ